MLPAREDAAGGREELLQPRSEVRWKTRCQSGGFCQAQSRRSTTRSSWWRSAGQLPGLNTARRPPLLPDTGRAQKALRCPTPTPLQQQSEREPESPPGHGQKRRCTRMSNQKQMCTSKQTNKNKTNRIPHALGKRSPLQREGGTPAPQRCGPQAGCAPLDVPRSALILINTASGSAPGGK